MAKCSSCGEPLVGGECESCGGESTEVSPRLDPHLLDVEVTAPIVLPGSPALSAVRRPTNAEAVKRTAPPSVAASERRASWYEMAAAVVTDPKLVVSKPPPPTTTLSGAHMLPDEEGNRMAMDGSSLPLILLVGMIIRHATLIYLGRLDGSVVALGVLVAAAFFQLTQKPILKPLVGLALIFEGGNSLYLASQVDAIGWGMVPSVAGALAALCAIALLVLSDPTISRFMLVLGLGAIGGSVITGQYYGTERGAEALPGRVFNDGTGLTWRVPDGMNLFDARAGLKGYTGPSNGLKAYFYSEDRRIMGGLIAAQLPPGAKLEKILESMDPPPAPPSLADDLIPEALRYQEVRVYRYPSGGTNLVFLQRAGDGRTLAMFMRGTTLDPGHEKDLFLGLIAGLTAPTGGHRAKGVDPTLLPVAPSPVAAPVPSGASAPSNAVAPPSPAPGKGPEETKLAMPPPVVPPGETRLGGISP